MRKKIVIFIIGLFIGASFIPICGSIGSKKEDVSNNVALNVFKNDSGKTIYVDDDWEDDPPNHKWDTIQEGITDAVDCDTVFVYNGTYYENLLIEKSIFLEGENKETTIIDGSDLKRVVNISCNNVTLKHFSIVHGRGGINVWRSDNITITENIIKLNKGDGLYFYRSNGNTITHNVISENGIFDPNVIAPCSGILIVHSSDTNISGNIVYGGSGWGMLIFSLNNSIISKNNITFNYFIGLDLYVSYDNFIIRNNFIENGKKRISGFLGDLTDNVHFLYVIFSYKKPYNNIWDGNFWGRGRILPKPVFGEYRIFKDYIFSIPWVEFDWHPAREPYDIP